MHILWKATVILVALSIIMIYLMLSKAKKSKHKIHYYAYVGGVCCPMIIAAITVGLGHFGLFFLSVLVMVLVGLIMLPFSRNVFLADEAEDARNTDVSEPLRVNDFFSWRSIPNLKENTANVKHWQYICCF